MNRYELRVRGVTAGIHVEGETAERAVREWAYREGCAPGQVIDARDAVDTVWTFVSIGNDVRPEVKP